MQTRRDALGQACFAIHIAVPLTVILGWIWPARPWLVVYLIFLPALFLHWKINRNSCLLNNLENWLRYRRWRAPEHNPEEGAWLRTLLANSTGIVLTRSRMDTVIYLTMGVCWLLGLARLLRKF